MSESAYHTVRGGALKLGGVEVKRSEKHKKKKHKKEKRERDEQPEEVEETAIPAPIVVKSGSGRITTSNNTVQGHEGTKFMEELKPGDAIIITNPSTMRDETRIVKMVLSNVAIGISSAFSSDLISTTSFRYVNAPEDIVAIESAERAKKKQAKSEEDSEGLLKFAQGEKFAYRVMRKGKTGYDIVTEDVAGRSRGDLLNTRAKKKADRMCM